MERRTPRATLRKRQYNIKKAYWQAPALPIGFYSKLTLYNQNALQKHLEQVALATNFHIPLFFKLFSIRASSISSIIILDT